MTVLESLAKSEFTDVLKSSGRSPEIPESEDVYGWLVGDWELDIRYYWGDVSKRGVKGEVHADWALEGRAVQDVWIMPQRGRRPAVPDKKLNMYGSTMRVWDPSIRAWRITWINPVADQHLEQIGRRVGDEIVQIGAAPYGMVRRWRFTELTRDSFHWIGEALQPDGKSWSLEGEFLARRVR